MSVALLRGARALGWASVGVESARTLEGRRRLLHDDVGTRVEDERRGRVEGESRLDERERHLFER